MDSTKIGNFKYGEYEFEYEPFYIGKETSDRIITSKCDWRTFKSNKIKSISNLGGQVISKKLHENISFEDSITLEKQIIQKIGRRDLHLGPLTNLTDGGEGRLNGKNSPESIEKSRQSRIKTNKRLREMGHNFTPSEETKMKLREINVGEKNPMWGKTHTDEIKESHSKRVSGVNHPMFGKKHNESTKELIRESRSKSVDQELFNKLSKERNSKTILQFSLDGEFIQEHESIKVASQNTGLSESLIGKTCRGVVKNPRKFVFKFKNEEDKILTNSFLIKVGDIHQGYKLIKRNKKISCCGKFKCRNFNIETKRIPYFLGKEKTLMNSYTFKFNFW